MVGPYRWEAHREKTMAKKTDKKKITLSISQKNAEKLKRVAALRNMSQSDIVDEALNEEFGEVSKENLDQVDTKIAQPVGPIRRSKMIQGNSSVRDALVKSRQTDIQTPSEPEE